jgi:fructose-1,6-bisphosphatase II / sedoheptulose-1,7-bisphosphatase
LKRFRRRIQTPTEEAMADMGKMDRNLALEAVRVTEAAALAASKLMGRGDEKMADQAAVDAMRTTPNALAVMAMAEHGGFLNAPDVYMDKIAVGGGLPEDIVDLDKTPRQNLTDLAKAKKIDVADLVVCILDRPRHSELIAKVREAGARIVLIGDGDVSGVIATSTGDSGIDIYMGSGGAPEGVLAAAALRAIGGQIQGRLLFRNDDEKARARKWGITDLNRKYSMTDMAKGDVMFAATGVTSGSMLKGVRRFHNGAETHSIVMRSKTGTVRWVSAHHNFTIKTGLPSWA